MAGTSVVELPWELLCGLRWRLNLEVVATERATRWASLSSPAGNLISTGYSKKKSHIGSASTDFLKFGLGRLKAEEGER